MKHNSDEQQPIQKQKKEETKLPYKIISDEIIDIYEKVNVSELVTALSKRNCIVNDFTEKGESLESYYLNLIVFQTLLLNMEAYYMGLKIHVVLVKGCF